MIARKYAYLVALAREKHFGRAAAACHVSPSTLSTAIRDLEEELGVALVERGQHFAGLTPEGIRVVDQAQRMLAAAESLKQELASRREGLSGCLRLGVIPTALGVVASLTALFARRHPRVSIRVESASTGDILARLRAFDLEVGVIYMESCQGEDLSALQLWEESHVFLTPADRAGERMTWREAAELPLCLLTPDMHNRQTIDRVFAELGCRPRVSLETNSILSLLAHVCAGPWSTILPRSVLELIGTPRGVRVLDLEEPAVAWRTAIVTLEREPRSPMVDALLAQARNLREAFDRSE